MTDENEPKQGRPRTVPDSSEGSIIKFLTPSQALISAESVVKNLLDDFINTLKLKETGQKHDGLEAVSLADFCQRRNEN